MTPLKRLLVATPLYPPDPGGPATYAALLARELPARGILVDVVSFGEVRHLPKVVRHIAYFFRILSAAKHVDAILALDPVSVGLPALLASRLTKKDFFVKVVGDYAWEQGRQRFGVTLDLDTFVQQKKVGLVVGALRRIQTYVAKRSVRVLVPSYYLQSIISQWGIGRDHIRVVYNAVESLSCGDCPSELNGVRRPLIVTIGRLVEWKHIDGIIDALGKLVEQGIPATLAIVGSGPLEKTLRSKVRDSKAQCIFLGSRTPEETQSVLAMADVLVLNSSYEGLSHVLIEGLIHGKTIIATEAGGNPEVITDGVSGVLIPVNDTPALTQALVRTLEDSGLRARLEEGARAARTNYSVESMVSGTIAALT